MAFSQLAFLTDTRRPGDSPKLIQNALFWLANGRPKLTKFCVCGFDPTLREQAVSAVKTYGFFSDVRPISQVNSQNHGVLMIPSDLVLTAQDYATVVDYVTNQGGGLAVFYVADPGPVVLPPTTQLLRHFGLSFAGVIINENVVPTIPMNVTTDFSTAGQASFRSLVDKFGSVLGGGTASLPDLIGLIHNLRCQMTALDNDREFLPGVISDVMAFLERTHYQTPEGLFREPSQALVGAFLGSVFPHVDPDFTKAAPEHYRSSAEVGSFELSFPVMADLWLSTGLWLPAGAVGQITFSDIAGGLTVQVGSLVSDLSAVAGPYQRWPVTFISRRAKALTTKVASPFGGIVYLSWDSPAFDAGSITAVFDGFCRHPVVDSCDPTLWEETRDLDVPWGEIVIDKLIFTVPTALMRQIGDFAGIFRKYRTVMKQLDAFMHPDPPRSYRVIFDVNLVEKGPSLDYPILCGMDQADSLLLKLDRVTEDFFALVCVFSTLSLRDCFDTVTETAIGSVAAAVVCQALFPDFDPKTCDGFEPPPLFPELWKIQKIPGQDLISKTLAIFQDLDYEVSDVPEDLWIDFVKEMSRLAGINFTPLLETARPIPLNVAESLHDLPQFSPELLLS
jgi:hypothetical protein